MKELTEKKIKERTEKIIFRVKPEMKQFVKEFASRIGLDVSDLMRMILQYYFMSYFTGTFNFEDMKKRFFEMYPNSPQNNSSNYNQENNNTNENKINLKRKEI